jgi:DNA-binding Lrp family transcriptional regulator
MISALVLLNTDINASQDGVLENIKQVKSVQEAHSLFGVYDLLVKVKAASIDELKNITNACKRVAGVISSFTLMIDDHEDAINLSASPTGI